MSKGKRGNHSLPIISRCTRISVTTALVLQVGADLGDIRRTFDWSRKCCNCKFEIFRRVSFWTRNLNSSTTAARRGRPNAVISSRSEVCNMVNERAALIDREMASATASQTRAACETIGQDKPWLVQAAVQSNCQMFSRD